MATPSWLTKADKPEEFSTTERCHITELLNGDACPEMSVALARVEPKVATQLHALKDVTERYILRRGQGLMEVDGEQHPVSAGDQILIAANLPQRIINTGTIDLEFYCVCTPRFTVESYVDLESE
ncbi:MAG: cupin domain-containing protein [Granulosicoccus sp.]|nr:cupin domain-containing protein [Granulosicoccus sp.]